MSEGYPPPPMMRKEGVDLVLMNDGCKLDQHLNVSSPPLSWDQTFDQPNNRKVSTFPFLKTFINLASIAYEDHITEENYWCEMLRIFGLRATPADGAEKFAETTGVPKGFVFLAEAKGTTSRNGYYGVAYVNKENRQVILSHRGTVITNSGADWTDLKSIWWGAYTPQVSSAITFAHLVAIYARVTSCQLFFTGHSLGAWLAQITCFSTKYLTMNKERTHFVKKAPDLWDELHPYTVAFDSPGALQYLQEMKDHLFPRNEPQAQMQVNVSCLPVEVIQFHPNLVNTVNTQIGSVYLVDLKKAGVSVSYVGWRFVNKAVTLKTHFMEPVNKFLSEIGNETEDRVLRNHVIDWRIENLDDFLHKWGEEGRSVPVVVQRFPEFFLTAKEVEVLKEQREVGGCYEGLSLEDERIANRLVEYLRGGEVFVEGNVQFGAELDRREAISCVRHFVQALKNEVIWWNPRKSRIPSSYIERRLAETHHLVSNWIRPPKVPTLRLVEETSDRLILLVDPPGMGKSSEVSALERKLRNKVTNNRIVIRVNLNEVQTALKFLPSIQKASSVLFKLAPFLKRKSLEIPDVRVFVLLDGLDEVCPRHQRTMINLLRIFNSNEESITSQLRVVVTTRPHLREALEDEFNLKSWSLVLLTKEEQDEYIKSVLLGVSSENLSEIRGNLAYSVSNLLGNPLMLSMFVDAIKSGDDFSGDDLNIFDLYTRFVDSKHELHLVEKEKLQADDNYTEQRLELMLERNLPQYHRVAVRELVEEEEDYTEDTDGDDENKATIRGLILTECEGTDAVDQREPLGSARKELLSVGLLIEGSEGHLVFKHRSFAEYFYARLLTQEESLPQSLRDALFGNIYAGNVLENVEAFLVGVSSSTSASMSKIRRTTTGEDCFNKTALTYLPTSPLLFSLSPKWLLIRKGFKQRCNTLRKFVFGSQLFPLLVREVLLSFVNDEQTGDLWEAHKILMHRQNREAFAELIIWMSENEEWTRGEMLKINQVIAKTTPLTSYPVVAVARLMVAIGVLFEPQELLSEEELRVVVNSCDHRLAYIVPTLSPEEQRSVRKWEWVEGLLPGGKSQLRELFMQIDGEDLSAIVDDRETAWKLVEILTQEEIFARVSEAETRVSDVIGEFPQEMFVILGSQFVPRKVLAEFRWKFGKKNKGKTVFETLFAVDFAVEYLWGDLMVEVQSGNTSGPVTVAAKEALGRMDELNLLRFIETLEVEAMRERVGSPHRWQHGQNQWEKTGAENHAEEAMVMDWVTRGLQWSHTFTLDCLKGLPFLLCYWGNVDHGHLANLLQQKKHQLTNSWDVLHVLRSLVILSSPRPYGDDKDDPILFSILSSFLREIISLIPQQFQFLAEVFLEATRDQIRAAALPSPARLVSKVCVGGVTLNLMNPTTTASAVVVEKDTWKVIVREVIEFTPCIDFPSVFLQLTQKIEELNDLEMLKKEVLTNEDVLGEWQKRFSSDFRKEGEGHADIMCGVRNMLSFYFSLFGVNLDWMGWLVERIPVEISNALRESDLWIHLLPTLQAMLGELLRDKVVSVDGVATFFSYKTDAEWETLLSLINGEALLPGTPTEFASIASAIAAPFVRALIKRFGVEWTRSKLTVEFWNAIPSTVSWDDSSVGSLSSLFLSALKLGQLEEARRLAWPGVASWKKGEGKTSLEFAREKYDGLPIEYILFEG